MAFSKHLAGANCTEIMHPWTDSCVRAYGTMFRSSIIGGAKMFLPIILVEYALKLRRKENKLNEKMAKEFFTDLFQSIAMGSSVSTLLLVYSCILRHTLGRYTYISIVFIPGFLTGLSSVLLNPKLRSQMLIALSNAALESVLLKMSHSGLLMLNVCTETAFFMVTNACLMYASKASKSNNSNYTWFFKPDENGNLSPNSIYKKTRNYFGLGLGFGILRTLAGDVTVLSPKNIHRLFNARTLKPGIFAGSYVAVYELIVYMLNQYFQKDLPIFALPAGFLAGLSYAFEPNLSINLSLFINLIQILYKLVDTGLLKRGSVDTILFCMGTGTIFHMQLMYPKSVSKFGSNFIRSISQNKSSMIIEAFKRCSLF